jgi:hypothetical protein
VLKAIGRYDRRERVGFEGDVGRLLNWFFLLGFSVPLTECMLPNGDNTLSKIL